MGASGSATGARRVVGPLRFGGARIGANGILQVVDELLRHKLLLLKGVGAAFPPPLWKGVGNVDSRCELAWHVDRVEVGAINGVGESVVVCEVEVYLAGTTLVDPCDQGLGADDVGTRGIPPALPGVSASGAGCAAAVRGWRSAISIW